MSADNSNSEVPVSYRTVQIERTLEDHEGRISRNEQFRLMAQGALAVVSFGLGSGFVLAIVLYILGLL